MTTAGREVFHIPVMNNNNETDFFSSTQMQSTPKFTIRDNTTFRCSPTRKTSDAAMYLTPNGINCRQRSVSPHRLKLRGNSASQQVAASISYQQEPTGRPLQTNAPASYSDYQIPVSIVTTNSLYRQPDRSQTFAQVSSYTPPNHLTSAPDPLQSFGFQPQGYQQPNYEIAYQPVNGSSQQAHQNKYNELPERADTDIYSTIGSSESCVSPASLQQIPVHHSSYSSEPPCAPNAPAGPPPPPPAPPIPAGGIPSLAKLSVTFTQTSQAPPISSLAAVLQAKTLKKTPKVETSTIPPPLVGTKSMLMEEMQKKLAWRRAKVDGEDTTTSASCSARSSPFQALRSNTTSPMPFSKSITKEESVGDCWQDGISTETLPAELEQLKHELLFEIRKELHQFKCNIIAGIKEVGCQKNSTH